jgi:hypothetical protein
MELQGFKNKNGGLATDEPQDSAKGPVDPFMEPCIVTDCHKCMYKLSRLLLKC